jgi:aldose 1-epimerase
VATDSLILEAGDARLRVSPSAGGRIASLVVAGHELLITDGVAPISWGCYPMVPFAGRIRDGRFRFDGRDIQLARNLPPNAIHGTVFDRPWTVSAPDTLAIDLGPAWPFAGRVEQRFDLKPEGLEVTLSLEADEPMPGALGWHPWFRRVLTGTSDEPLTPSAQAELRFDAAQMYVRDAAGLPTGELVPPRQGPWDDCFTRVMGAPRLTWPGTMTLEIDSDCDHWVIYDEPSGSICVEPQTAPPDFPSIAPRTIEPGAPLHAVMRWRWWPGELSDEAVGKDTARV